MILFLPAFIVSENGGRACWMESMAMRRRFMLRDSNAEASVNCAIRVSRLTGAANLMLMSWLASVALVDESAALNLSEMPEPLTASPGMCQ